ncbi:hypothetical protein ACFQRB_18425 [Halobaculum litoreum]|uniref:Uncharacterized protein n=1 Tax=Halobaculum litoreum TaxID=3031998 RepID=A0ABD5XRY5_9EURY
MVAGGPDASETEFRSLERGSPPLPASSRSSARNWTTVSTPRR